VALVGIARVESVGQFEIDDSELPRCRHDNVSRFEVLVADVVTMDVGDVGQKRRPGII
jgi:hypothetical protein